MCVAPQLVPAVQEQRWLRERWAAAPQDARTPAKQEGLWAGLHP